MLKYETVYEVAVTSLASVQEMVIVVVETETTDRNNASDREKENINLASVYAVRPDIIAHAQLTYSEVIRHGLVFPPQRVDQGKQELNSL